MTHPPQHLDAGRRRPLLELEDLWAMADQSGKRGAAMTFDEMNVAKTQGSKEKLARTAKVRLLK